VTQSSLEALDAEAVAAYLRRKDDFLLQFPDLASSLKLPKEGKQNTASFASYQLDVLREKNTNLSTRLGGLIQVAQDNEVLAQRVHLLSLRLLRSKHLIETVNQIAASLQEDFHTDLLSLCLIDAPALSLQANWLKQVKEADPGLAEFAEMLRHQQAMCGRLKLEKLEFLFAERAEQVASAVVIPLNPVGLLAVGSSDPNRFHPGMGTVFLEQMAELIRTAIAVQIERGEQS
jgi:uncharacterized protein